MVGYPLALIPKWSLGLKQKFQREEMKKKPAQKQSLDNVHFIYKRVCGNKLYRWIIYKRVCKVTKKIKKVGLN